MLHYAIAYLLGRLRILIKRFVITKGPTCASWPTQVFLLITLTHTHTDVCVARRQGSYICGIYAYLDSATTTKKGAQRSLFNYSVFVLHSSLEIEMEMLNHEIVG